MRSRPRNCCLLAALAVVCACGVARADDTLVYMSGVKLECKVIRLTDDGHVLFKVPFLDAEARGVLAQISDISLQGIAKPDVATDAVVLVNGDWLVGELVAMGADKIVLKSVILGKVEFPRSAVAMTTFQVGNVLHETDFRYTESTAPWKVYRGSAAVSGGVLTGKRGTMLSMAMDQKKALTMEVVFVRRKTDRVFTVPYVDMILFADSRTNGYGMNSVRLDMDGYQLGFGSVHKGRHTAHMRGTRFQWRTQHGMQPKPVRVSYDPNVPEMICWVEGRMVRRQKLLGRLPRTGKHISLNLTGRARAAIQSIRVMSGVMPPICGVRDDAANETDTIVMADGQRYTAESVVLTPEGYVAQTPGGKMTIKREQVVHVLFARGKREIPRRVKGDARVQAGSHAVTMQLSGLTPTELTGTSAVFGAVKVDRANVRLISLNIYSSPPPPKKPKPRAPTSYPYPIFEGVPGGLKIIPIPMPPMER